jgi:hypothetical protein
MRLTTSICGAVLVGLLAMPSAYHPQVQQPEPIAGQGLSAAAPPTDWRNVDAGAFSILAPLGWKFRQLQGIDSYVGEFIGEGVVLRFDFGGYSNPLKEEKEPAYLVVHKSIAGLRAKIVSPKTPGHGVTGIYFPKTFGSNKLCLFGQDLNATQQELALKIFETIRFGRSVPPILPPPAEGKPGETADRPFPGFSVGSG